MFMIQRTQSYSRRLKTAFAVLRAILHTPSMLKEQSQRHRVGQRVLMSRASAATETIYVKGSAASAAATVTTAAHSERCVSEPISLPIWMYLSRSTNTTVPPCTIVCTGSFTILYGMMMISPWQCSACFWGWTSEWKPGLLTERTDFRSEISNKTYARMRLVENTRRRSSIAVSRFHIQACPCPS